MEEKKSAAEWHEELNPDVTVYDYDGFDRSNFVFSWNEEQLTKVEYNDKLMMCTISWNAWKSKF